WEFDFWGASGKSLWQIDWARLLNKTPSLNVRILILNPSSDAVERFATFEKTVSVEELRSDIATIKNAVARAKGMIDNPDRLEIRFQEITPTCSMYRVDDEVFIQPFASGKIGLECPLVHLKNRNNDGLFTVFTRSFSEVWNISGVP